MGLGGFFGWLALRVEFWAGACTVRFCVAMGFSLRVFFVCGFFFFFLCVLAAAPPSHR